MMWSSYRVTMVFLTDGIVLTLLWKVSYDWIMLHSGCSGLVVSMLASGTRVRGFKPGWSCRIFSGDIKIHSMPSFGGEVKPSVPCRSFTACKRSVHLPWKSQNWIGHFLTHTSLPCSQRSLTSSDVECLWRWWGIVNQAVHNRPSWGRHASGLQSPGSAPHKEEEEPCCIPCNNALRKLLSFITVTCKMCERKCPIFMIICGYLWHPVCIHFSVFQLVMGSAKPTTHQNV
jgi:hypothetical protein